jgi:uncharacterized protein with PQ loop repeat
MCDPGAISWIEDAFGDCIVTPLDQFSFAVGMASNLIFLISSIPQIVLNFRRKKVDGQSPLYFPLLFLGSAMNLLAAIITHGLVTQLLAGLFYVLTDGTLFFQFIAYKYILKTNDEPSDDDSSISSQREETGADGLPLPGPIITGAMMLAHASATDYAHPYTGDQLSGTIFGWLCALIFNACRIPQIIKNASDKHMGDFSVSYVIMNITGNLTYAASVIMRRTDPDYLWKQAPFLVSSLGPMLCDIIIMGQRWYYRSGGAVPTSDEEETEANAVAEL